MERVAHLHEVVEVVLVLRQRLGLYYYAHEVDAAVADGAARRREARHEEVRRLEYAGDGVGYYTLQYAFT